MRGRGWLASYSVGNRHRDAPGVPLVTAFRWDTGVQAHVANDFVDLTASITAGTLSNPLLQRRQRRPPGGRTRRAASDRRPDRRSVGRARAVRLDAGGASRRWARATARSRRRPGAATSNIPGTTTSCASRRSSASGRCRSLGRRSSTLPLRALATSSRDATSCALACTSRRASTIWASARSPARRVSSTWDAPVTRFEAGGGYSLQRNLLLKLAAQFDARDGGRTRTGAGSSPAQLVFWF